jgi:hypothetical protein
MFSATVSSRSTSAEEKARVPAAVYRKREHPAEIADRFLWAFMIKASRQSGPLAGAEPVAFGLSSGM